MSTGGAAIVPACPQRIITEDALKGFDFGHLHFAQARSVGEEGPHPGPNLTMPPSCVTF